MTLTSIYKYIILCLDNCPKPNCADVNEQLKLQSEGQLSTVEEENDLFEKPEDDSVTTSTSVYVAQPGSPESGENYFLIFAPKKLGLHWLPTKFIFFCFVFGNYFYHSVLHYAFI